MSAKGQWHAGKAVIGIVLIFIGLVYLGVSMGFFDWSVWLQLWRLWPAVIIGIGITFLFQHRVSRVIAVIIFVLLLLLSFWFLWQKSEFQKNGAVAYRDVYESLVDGVDRGKISVEFPRATVRISGPSDTRTFVTGRAESKGSEHTWESQVSGTTQEVVARQLGPDVPFVGTEGFVELQATQNLPLTIDIESGKLDATLDVTSLQVDTIDISSGASTIVINYGDKLAEVRTSITTGASALSFTAPQHVGVMIETDSALTATSLDSFEQDENGVYKTEGFAEAEKKLYITIDSGVASIEFTRV